MKRAVERGLIRRESETSRSIGIDEKSFGKGQDDVTVMALSADGDDQFNGTRQIWLYNEENLSDMQLAWFDTLRDQDLETAKAWVMKENFRPFWDLRTKRDGRAFYNRWFKWVESEALAPMQKVATMIKDHLPNILSWFRYRMTNARSERFNSRIQSIKSNARGFKSFENYRTRILFCCEKLDRLPSH
ncbi:MAG: transposase [Planctomycetota bacterium]